MHQTPYEVTFFFFLTGRVGKAGSETPLQATLRRAGDCCPTVPALQCLHARSEFARIPRTNPRGASLLTVRVSEIPLIVVD